MTEVKGMISGVNKREKERDREGEYIHVEEVKEGRERERKRERERERGGGLKRVIDSGSALATEDERQQHPRSS